MLVLLISCSTASRSPGGSGGVVFDESIAVLGVVSAVQPLSAFRRKELVNRLEAQLRASDTRRHVLPHQELRTFLSTQEDAQRGRYDVMLAQYRLNSALDGRSVEMLRQMRLPVRYVVLARVETNTTRKFRELNNHVRNSRGELLNDRREVTLIHQREAKVSAHLYDTYTGRLAWQGTYESKPETKRAYTEYTGSSFVGSLAISLANSFVQGRGASRFPNPPDVIETFEAAFRRIASEVAGY